MKRLQELTAQQRIDEAPAGTDAERKIRKWVKNAEAPVDQLNAIVHGNTLKTLLKEGGFPETESKDMRDKFDAFHDAFLDLVQGVLTEFGEMPDEPGREESDRGDVKKIHPSDR